MRAPADMPAAPQPFDPAGLCPDQPRGDMNTQSTINPLASSDVGGTAGHDAAACASARGKCDGERVCDARDANCVLSPTTQSLPERQVVAPHNWDPVHKHFLLSQSQRSHWSPLPRPKRSPPRMLHCAPPLPLGSRVFPQNDPERPPH